MPTPSDPRFPRRPPPPPLRTSPNRAIVPHPPTDLETRDLADLGERAAHPFPQPRPEVPGRPADPARGAPGTPATMPTQRPGSTPSQPTEQPRPHPPRPVPRSTATAGVNQGEGDRASARIYAEHVHQFVESGGVEPAARDAARAVDGPEGARLRAAEDEGKRPARMSLLDRAKGALRRVVEVIRERRPS
jgi:hypothetical protein